MLVHAAGEGETGFWAEVEELPGCFGSGRALDELKSDVQEAIASYLLALAARGDAIGVEAVKPRLRYSAPALESDGVRYTEN